MIEYVSMEPSRQENQSVELHIRLGRTGDIFLNLRHQGVNGSNFGAQAFHVLVQLRHRLAARVGKWVGFWNNHAMPSCYPIPFVCIYSVLIIGVGINIYIYKLIQPSRQPQPQPGPLKAYSLLPGGH